MMRDVVVNCLERCDSRCVAVLGPDMLTAATRPKIPEDCIWKMVYYTPTRSPEGEVSEGRRGEF